MQPPDDSALLRQYADTSAETAFALLVERHINLVYSVALRLAGNPHQAEEITQAVFIVLARKAASLRHGRALSSWLFQTTRLTTGNLVRSEIRRHRREQEAHMESLLNEPSPAGNEAWPQIAPLLDTAIAGLSEKDRLVIVLRFFEDRSLAEVGRALGANEDAARMRVNRALEKLRQYFLTRGVSSTSAIIAGAMSAHSVQAAPTTLANSVTAVAATKGAAAGGSTLTLIKGALKIMAWTKLKTAVVIGVAAILALSTATVAVKMVCFPAIKDAFFEPNYRHFQSLSSGLFVLRPTHFGTPPNGLDYSAEGTSPSGEHVTRMMGRNRSFEQLVARIYSCNQSQIVFPAGVPKEHFDYLFTILDNRAQERFATVIKKKLGYVANWQEHNTDVFLLKVQASTPPRLQPGGPSNKSMIRRNSPNQLEFRNRPLRDLAYEIENSANVPVRDETGLTDAFNFDLDCRQTDLENGNWDALNEALGQLGLELVCTNLPLKMLVVQTAN